MPHNYIRHRKTTQKTVSTDLSRSDPQGTTTGGNHRFPSMLGSGIEDGAVPRGLPRQFEGKA